MSRVYSVGQVSKYIANLIDQDFLLGHVSVKGEISNCKYHSMGHIYFTLKDENGSMPCVMFKGNVSSGLTFTLQDGQAVIIDGSVKVYERDSRINLYARKIVMDGDGEGRLNLLYEKLKQKLYDEGLFDFEHKKPIPKHPKKVGIVTASTGAAIQDICNIAKRRNPYVELILYPAKVQGDGAAETIARGIRVLDKMGLDTIIVGRGGGSIEDLWAFNEEIVARAIFEADTPVISGTGHEVDNTIADYVADLRAPTPSAAAELAIPDIMTVLRQAESYRTTLNRLIRNRISLAGSRCRELEERLHRRGPEAKLRLQQLRLTQLSDRLHGSMRSKADRMRQRALLLTERLHGLSPTAKLKGGFGYLESGGSAVGSAENVKKGDTLDITLHDGVIRTEVQQVTLKHQDPLSVE